MKKGYGFITGEDNVDYFVHHSNISMEGYRKLVDGQSVEFEPSKNEKGQSAINVKPLDNPTQSDSSSRRPQRRWGRRERGEVTES